MLAGYFQLKTIGIIGGSSDQATVAYYRFINAAVNRRLGGWNTAEIIIASVNFGKIERFVREENWGEAGHYLSAKARGLELAGADLILCVSNTLHRVADSFLAGVRIPFLHIVDPAGTMIRHKGLGRVGLLGTRPVMSSDYIRDRYQERFGLEVMVPEEDRQWEIDRIIFDELVRGRRLASSKSTYLAAVDDLRERGAEGVILGCTEIFLLIDQRDRPDFPMFNTTQIHAEAAADWAIS